MLLGLKACWCLLIFKFVLVLTLISYDPPIAISERAIMAQATTSTAPESRKASPCHAPSFNGPDQTWTVKETSLTSKYNPINGLGSIVYATNGPDRTYGKDGFKTKTQLSEFPPASRGGLSEQPDGSTGSDSKNGIPTVGIESSKQLSGTESHTTMLGLGTSDPRKTAKSGPSDPISPTHTRAIILSSGVLVDGVTLRPGRIETIGSVGPPTPVSMLEDGGSTFLVYGQTSTELVKGSEAVDHPTPTVSLNSKSQFVVNGQTLAPGTPITLDGEDGPVTFRMLTTSSHTFIAIGTSETVPLGGTTSIQSDAALAFTQASDGNFVLHGTTLASGKPVTIGTGSFQTTLRMTTVNSTPAIILDGSLTELLGHATQPETSSSSIETSLPAIIKTHGPKQTSEPPANESKTFSTSSRSESVRAEFGHFAFALVSVLTIIWVLD